MWYCSASALRFLVSGSAYNMHVWVVQGFTQTQHGVLSLDDVAGNNNTPSQPLASSTKVPFPHRSTDHPIPRPDGNSTHEQQEPLNRGGDDDDDDDADRCDDDEDDDIAALFANSATQQPSGKTASQSAPPSLTAQDSLVLDGECDSVTAM